MNNNDPLDTDTESESDIESGIDFIIKKSEQLFTVIEKKQYHLLETRELVRKQLINQFFANYSSEQMLEVSEKFHYLITISAEITQQCEDVLQQTKEDIIKLKKSKEIKNAYGK